MVDSQKLLKLFDLINEVSDFCTQSGNKVGKKLIQKIVYLLQRKGIDFGYTFSIHYYGPYSSQLEFDIHRMELNGLINIESDGYTHKIIPVENRKDVLNSKETLNNKELIKSLCNFTARELELIATVDYVISQMKLDKLDNKTEKILIERIFKLKGNKYSEEEIKNAIEFLIKYNFLKPDKIQ
ncbi:conserved hypothetical protein [Caldicellulosiruptor hydrothermalis 108]|uniref:Antitoxin SocA-like Panacea domain-containing protein n=1 Tax=Caldicellulosiruptor hydrothermalis (strain DSM 18901 / VKM B-2411 / 108) TaxID=632292 RepID=E4QCF7_CALH1|nr:hypothetical protein [Caldicellulosiruptor hydrothermalis]ADQ06253.1 conserved hypothetical protein [Caldicellulosiruptor hydrothermalis 108]